MMTLNEMKARKRELRYTNEEIAQLSGVPLGTVQKVFAGVTAAPRRKTLEALERALFSRPLVRYDDFPEETPHIIREGALSYHAKKQGGYTIYDYYALPDDRRVELIDSVFYDMAAPTFLHQTLLTQMVIQLSVCAAKKNTGYHVIPAPYDIRLDKDLFTMVQPDILAFRGDPLEHNHHFEGAPEFVVEILSPSSRSKDMVLKFNKYQNAGVREFWVVDPKYRKVTVWSFDGDILSSDYGFQDRVPVHISDGKCFVDFKEIWPQIACFYDKHGKLLPAKKDEDETD